MRIPATVMRFDKPDTDFGKYDRSVPVILAQFFTIAQEKGHHLWSYAILVEEYIAEQWDFRILDGLLVLNDDKDLTYDECGLDTPSHYDTDIPADREDVTVHTWDMFERRTRTAVEKDGIDASSFDN